ncbi:MAG: hypothetical protein AABX60_03660, partial [Nanoarchaeota archaeon]
MASDENRKEEKGFGEGIEVVKDAHPEENDEKDIEINFGKVFSFFKGKEGKSSGQVAASEAKPPAEEEHKVEHKAEHIKAEHTPEHKQAAHQGAEHRNEHAKTKQEHKTAHHSSGTDVEKKTEKEEAKEDAEIDIGKLASGIKGFFKGKREEKDGKKETARPFFEKGRSKSEGGSEEEGDEVSLDFQSISDLFRRKGSTILLILGILIVIGMTTNVRLQPARLGFAEDWASNSVHNTIQSDIQSAVSGQYP